MMNNPEKDLLLNRPSLIWRLKRKLGEKCLEIYKLENDHEGILQVITKFTSLCSRGRKNKEITRVLVKAFKTLIEIDKREIALGQLEKNSVLNIKEKTSLKLELNIDNSISPL